MCYMLQGTAALCDVYLYNFSNCLSYFRFESCRVLLIQKCNNCCVITNGIILTVPCYLQKFVKIMFQAVLRNY